MSGRVKAETETGEEGVSRISRPSSPPGQSPLSGQRFRGPYNISSRIATLNHRLVGPPLDWRRVTPVPLEELLASMGQEPGTTFSHLVQAYNNTRDPRLLFYTEAMPVAPPVSDGAFQDFDQFLLDSRKYRKLVPAMDAITKKMVLSNSAEDCTCFKFEGLDLQGSIVHIGCGDLGCVSDFFIGDCDYADPRFNGVTWQQVDFTDYDNIVSDVAVPTEDGLGMDYQPVLLDKLRELAEVGKRVVYKAHIVEGFSGVHSKVRPHNAEAVFDSQKHQNDLEIADTITRAFEANDARNLAIRDHNISRLPMRNDIIDRIRDRASLRRQLRFKTRRIASSKPREYWGSSGIFDESLYNLLIDQGYMYPVDLIPMSLIPYRFNSSLREMVANFSEHWDTFTAAGVYYALTYLGQVERDVLGIDNN